MGILDGNHDIFGNKIKKNNSLGLNSIWQSPKSNKKDHKRQISKSEKNEVWERQNGKCARCHKQLIPSATQYDHIKPYAKGGETDTSNIQALCANCHSKKTNKDRVKEIKQKRAHKKEREEYWINPITGLKERRPPRLF